MQSRISVTVGEELLDIIEQGAVREGRSISQFTKRLLDRAAREQQVRAWQQEQPAPASSAA